MVCWPMINVCGWVECGCDLPLPVYSGCRAARHGFALRSWESRKTTTDSQAWTHPTTAASLPPGNEVLSLLVVLDSEA